MKRTKLGMMGVACVIAAIACGKTAGPGNTLPDGGTRGGDGGSGGMPPEPGTFVEIVSQKTVDKIDLLFMIDNSISMADKQAVLKDAVPDLVRRFLSPNCVDADGVPGATPADPTGACPAGTEREFTPIRNVHIGVITSSLGGHGAANCDGTSVGMRGEQENDHGHLIGSRPRFAAEAAKYPGSQPPDPLGFLDWKPAASGASQSVAAFTNTFQSMVTAASEFGCGYESQLEAIYRFLADPKPYERIDTGPCSATNSNPCAFPSGIDVTIINQRKEFLRPDSLVGVVLISDENDCSIIEKQQGYYAARADDIDLPRSTAACATNPNDTCCVSCITATPSGCQRDPSCDLNGGAQPDELDPPNLRCFNQKKRFGIDFLYPTDRYVNALTRRELCTSSNDLSFKTRSDCRDEDGNGTPDVVPNPLFDDLRGTGALPRDPGLVFLAGIVGVPWQDLKAQTNDSGSVTYPPSELHYQSASQLEANGVWDKILGTAKPPGGGAPIPPTNALMIESLSVRGGNDGQGVALAPPTSSALANPVNSHEWGNTRQDDLQYACIFRLPQPRDCTEVSSLPDLRPGCDCEEVRNGDLNPLCQNPGTNQYEKNQYFAKAYPAVRELQVLKDFGSQAIVASICARNVTDKTAQDYGYRPAVDAIVDRMSDALQGRCLPRQLEADENGSIPCRIVEARPSGTCDGDRNRSPVSKEDARKVRERLESAGVCGSPGQPSCEAFSLCALPEAGEACHGTGEQPQAGWCYVDPSQNPGDDPALVEKCRADEKRILRFVDPENRTPEPDAKVIILCEGA